MGVGFQTVTVNRRLNVTTDGYGLKPNLSGYLSQFQPPKFELGIGDVDALVNPRLGDDKGDSDTDKSFQPARDHASKANDSVFDTGTNAVEDKPAISEASPIKPEPFKSAAKPVETAKPAVAVKPAPAASEPKTPKAVAEPPKPVAEPAKPAPTAESAANSSGVFDKPSPFASAPPPPRPEEKEAPVAAAPKAPVAPLGSAPIPGLQGSASKADSPNKPPAAPLGSAPIPGLQSSSSNDDAPAKPPTAPLGSAPIPGLGSSATKDDRPAKPPVAPLGSAPIPPSQPAKAETAPGTPIDIEVTGEIPLATTGDKPDFESTVVMAPEPKNKVAKSLENKIAKNADGSLDFESTMVVAPDATLSNKEGESEAVKPTGNSTDQFINRVKEQLSDSEKAGGDKDKAFISTTPV